jgi:hypothetical protein
MEVMGESEHSQNEVSHENFDMGANDQTKQGPEPEIGTKTQNGPDSEVADGCDTSINVPDDNIGTDVISPGEGGSDDESDSPQKSPDSSSSVPTILLSNPRLSRKALMYQQNFLESK